VLGFFYSQNVVRNIKINLKERRKKMNSISRHKKIMDTISGVSIITFPILLLIGFLLHPDIMSLEQVHTPEQLVNNFHNNTMWHIGHLIVAFAIPFIIFSIMHFMNLLKGKGLWYGIIGGIGGIFGAVALALDKGSLCLILSGFDTLFSPSLYATVKTSYTRRPLCEIARTPKSYLS